MNNNIMMITLMKTETIKSVVIVVIRMIKIKILMIIIIVIPIITTMMMKDTVRNDDKDISQ